MMSDKEFEAYKRKVEMEMRVIKRMEEERRFRKVREKYSLYQLICDVVNHNSSIWGFSLFRILELSSKDDIKQLIIDINNGSLSKKEFIEKLSVFDKNVYNYRVFTENKIEIKTLYEFESIFELFRKHKDILNITLSDFELKDKFFKMVNLEKDDDEKIKNVTEELKKEMKKIMEERKKKLLEGK